MGCATCKSKKSTATSITNVQVFEKTNIGGYIFRGLLFLIAAAIVVALFVPLLLPLILIMLFNGIVLDRSTDLTGTTKFIGKILEPKAEKEEEIEEDINPEDYELLDVDEIK